MPKPYIGSAHTSGAPNLNRLAYFTAVIETGSFTAAAEQLGVTKAVVSQQVARLEQDVQTSLLIRSTRSVRTTQAGQLFYGRCVAILRDAEEAFAELNDGREAPTGVLRLTAPIDYGLSVIVPTITEFTKRYLNCRVETHFSDNMVDLMASDMDLAIRVGWLTQEHLQVRQVGTFKQHLVASPTWGDRLSDIQRPTELATLPWIANTALKKPRQCTFTAPNKSVETVDFTPHTAFDITLAVKEAVVSGIGLAVLPDYLVKEELKAGRLISVLPHWALASGNITAVFPETKFRPTKVRAFVDLLVERT
ncbi:DNA-binding transcriptional LysR family regulator [Vreelandella songnenensis]|uniref:DNA-binding transcriptional LysR family regulator n=1 Tax=Vreelandella songnenensis TaxID=1176243 RepID=A0A2T0V2B9_9GAMM|nr:LysR family transcriptional regulator [Halomonas songnenensis]PRY64208.1 DNA-binding transcriptional LysR family regulator [Halomonas songnenensis]